MKTHELAQALMLVAKMLREGPDVDLKDLAGSFSPSSSKGIAVNLSTLAELSRVDKRQWRSLVVEYGFPLKIRDRDASRDILGKLLGYLEKNPEAREKLKSVARSTAQQAPAPELLRALEVLARN